MAGGIFAALLDGRETATLLGDPAQARAMVEVERALAKVEAELGLIPASALGCALSERMPRAEAQTLVKRACATASASGRDLVAVVSELTDAPIDWPAVRARTEKPPDAERLVQRVLDALTP